MCIRDSRRSAHRFFQIAFGNDPLLISVVCPYTGHVIGLKFEPDRQAVHLGLADPASLLFHLLGDTEQILNVVRDLMCQDIGDRKVTARPIPVSYTHLDVYKRQEVPSSGAPYKMIDV